MSDPVAAQPAPAAPAAPATKQAEAIEKAKELDKKYGLVAKAKEFLKKKFGGSK